MKGCGPASSSRPIVLGIEPDAISVPAPAIQLGPQGPYLFVVKDGVADLRQVVIKRTQGGEAVIGKGLQPGEQVVIDGHLRLVNGANVTVHSPATPERCVDRDGNAPNVATRTN